MFFCLRIGLGIPGIDRHNLILFSHFSEVNKRVRVSIQNIYFLYVESLTYNVVLSFQSLQLSSYIGRDEAQTHHKINNFGSQEDKIVYIRKNTS